ncbi:hypothetical protein QA601_02235 [Chitinispirillales bacterium ANBcel5]|uniref:hypothetical protein n=1 Tax=Cellulosispirillum alkaliphilum TaxID=3039283 RepID=UPI002A51ADD7|nr:hypothetical protein [Chitinispirillales bacterium ANBcel5]
MKNIENLSIRELAALICENLNREGLKATLSGGACAEIYSNEKYVTGDLDFVVNYFWHQNDEIINKVMTALGFEKEGRIFINESVAYSVEFPPGPLGIGEQSQIKPVELNLITGNLSLLSPTDSVKDRLAGYFYGNDAQCLEQAMLICQMNKVNMNEIRRWAKIENQPEKFKEFEKRVGE